MSLGKVEFYLKLLQLPVIAKIFTAITIAGQIVQMYKTLIFW